MRFTQFAKCTVKEAIKSAIELAHINHDPALPTSQNLAELSFAPGSEALSHNLPFAFSAMELSLQSPAR